MKKFIFVISILFLFLVSGQRVYAVGAYPYPFKVVQPDGSVITVMLHGDEFLNWTTSGGKLVTKGDDGFYYNASFDLLTGKVVKSDRKVASGSVSSFASSRNISVPKIAVDTANEMRKAMLSTDNSFAGPAKSSSAANNSSIAKGKKRFLVLLVEFSDLKFTLDAPVTAFTNLLNERGYSANNATGSVYDYYYENSKGDFDPIFDVVGPVTLSSSYSYYGENKKDERYIEFVIDACNAADATVNFADYDTNNDGDIDNVFLYFAGYNEAEGGPQNSIWPHKWNVSYFKTVMLDGKRLSGYACTSEYKGRSGGVMCGIGTFCHEFGHVLGLPDFYDIDYEENGSANALGGYCLMSSGNYNNEGRTPPYLTSMERLILSWRGEFQELVKPGKVTLESVDNNKAFFTSTPNENEYFLYECRKKHGWDNYIEPGLLIYHVDMSKNVVAGYTAAQRWESGSINSVSSHQCFDLVESVYPEYSGMSMNEQVFPGKNNNTSFTSTSVPSNRAWSGLSTGFDINNIAYSADVVTFDLSITAALSGTVTNSGGSLITNADIKLTRKSDGVAKTTKTDSKGIYSFEGLSSGEMYDIEVSHSGYVTYSETFILSKASYVLSVTLNTPLEAVGEQYQKYYNGKLYNYAGTGKKPSTVYGAFSISADETAKSGIEGWVINNIVVHPNCKSLEKLEVVVFADGNELLRKDVNTADIVFNTDNSIDVSDERITIPSGKTVYIGYGVVNADNEYPLTADDGPKINGGFFISTDNCASWEVVDSYNLISSVFISSPGEPFKVAEYNLINSSKKDYSAGDKLLLSLIQYGQKPSSSTWYYDDAEKKEGETISLTQGNHTLKAVLKYSDGKEETISKVINVK